MITFKINGTRFKIPTCWQDVTYKNYIALLDCKNLIDYIALFTGIERDILLKAELRNVEVIAQSLSFVTVQPKFEAGPTKLVGPYVLPVDVTVESLGQFEDLRGLLAKAPTNIETVENVRLLYDLQLEACAIYCQKLIDGSYDYTKVASVKEQLKDYSCIEVIQTGAFFLFKPLNSLTPIRKPSRNIRQRLKKLIQDFPGYQKTLDSLQRSLENRKG